MISASWLSSASPPAPLSQVNTLSFPHSEQTLGKLHNHQQQRLKDLAVTAPQRLQSPSLHETTLVH